MALIRQDIGIVNKDGWTKQAAFSQNGHTAVSLISWLADERWPLLILRPAGLRACLVAEWPVPSLGRRIADPGMVF